VGDDRIPFEQTFRPNLSGRPEEEYDMSQQKVDRSRRGRRLGVAILAGALVAGVSGCGSRASDEAIAAALGGGAPAASGEVAGVASTPADALTGAVQPGAIQSGAGPSATGATSTGAVAETAGAKPAASGSTTAGVKSPAQPAAVPATKSVVKIGTLGPFSGLFGAVFDGIPKSVNVWAAAQNARGGVNGHPVKVIVGDDQADPPTALTLAKRMVESDGIIAMVANMNIFGFEQIEQYLRSKNIPLIGGDAVSPGWFTSPVAFPVTPPVATQSIKGLKQFVDQGAKKLAIVYCLEVSALCTYLVQEAQKSEVGPNIVQTYQVSLVAPSYTSQCLRMKSAGIEAMWLLMDSAGASRFVQNCASQGFKPKTMIHSLNVSPGVLNMPELAQSIVPSGTFPPVDIGLPAVSRYLQATSTYAPTLGHSGSTTYGWASAEMFGLAAKNLSDNPTSAELINALNKVSNETLGGLIPPVSYVKGKGPQAKPCIFIYAVTNGRWSAPNGAKLTC
jgi:branched-chain amino acid transport system substrate-binding protein